MVTIEEIFTIAIVVIQLRLSCDTIEYISRVQCPQGFQWINGVYIKTWRGLFDGEFLLARSYWCVFHFDIKEKYFRLSTICHWILLYSTIETIDS